MDFEPSNQLGEAASLGLSASHSTKTSTSLSSSETHCTDVAQFFLSTSGSEELEHVLRAILTPAEIEAISQRLSILDGLSNEIAQREIAEQLKVGIATVTRGSRVWQDNRRTLERYFPRCRKE